VDKTDEVLTIAQEECGELVQVVSKVRRFGLEGNRSKLTQEAGDVLCMIELMVEQGIVTEDELSVAKQNKRKKLEVWSNIFRD
jgi:NTP pyrophosphatase (non-canonical NTP hydrolase)